MKAPESPTSSEKTNKIVQEFKSNRTDLKSVESRGLSSTLRKLNTNNGKETQKDTLLHIKKGSVEYSKDIIKIITDKINQARTQGIKQEDNNSLQMTSMMDLLK